jgi:hypothetical protein
MKRQDFKMDRMEKKLRKEIKELKLLEDKIRDFALRLNSYAQKSELNDKIREVG